MGRGSRTEGVGSLLVNSVSIGRIEVIGRNRKCAEKVDREFFVFFFFFFPLPVSSAFLSVPRYARRDASCTTRKLVIYVSGRKLAIEGTATCYRHCGERREKVRVTSICLVRETVIYCFFFRQGSYAFIRQATRGKRRYVPPRLFEHERKLHPRVFILPKLPSSLF